MKLLTSFTQILLFLIVSSQLTFAQTALKPQGEGTESFPYFITNWQELYWVSQNSSSWSSHFLQTQNIDFADASPSIVTWDDGHGWTPIGRYSVDFEGVYDGGGHTVKGLYCNRPEYDDQGMFGWTSHARVCNLGVEDAAVYGNTSIGILIGRANNSEVDAVYNCYVTGTVKAEDFVGGLIGVNFKNQVKNCYSMVAVTSSNYTTDTDGAFIGQAYHLSDIVDCYSTGRVRQGTSSYPRDKGFIGTVFYDYEPAFSNFWDVDVSYQTSTGGDFAVGLATEEMKKQDKFVAAGWDFVGELTNGDADVWQIDPLLNDSYPSLTVFQQKPIYPILGTVSVEGNSLAFEALLYSVGFDCSKAGVVCSTKPVKSLFDADIVAQDEFLLDTIARLSSSFTDLGYDTDYFIRPYAIYDGDTIWGSEKSALTHKKAQGEGTQESPYLISDWKELYWLSQTPSVWGAHFLQTKNIDLDEGNIEDWDGGMGWSPIGSTYASPFKGSYNGNGMVIKGLYCKRSENYAGLFGRVYSGTILGVGLVDVSITGGNYAGALCGLVSSGTIERCYAKGGVYGTNYIGGLIGDNHGNVSNCYARVRVTNTSLYAVGGFVGKSTRNISYSYSTGTVTKSRNGDLVAKGFIGELSSTVYNPADYKNYLDTVSSKHIPLYGEDAGFVYGVSSEEMKDSVSYIGWDFENIWNISPAINDGYPILRSPSLSVAFECNIVASDRMLFNTVLGVGDREVTEYGMVGALDAENCFVDKSWTFKKDKGSASEGKIEDVVVDGLTANTVYYCRMYAVTATDTLYSVCEKLQTNTQPTIIPQGDGTAENPYLISNWQELLWLSENTIAWDKHMLQTADIDFADASPAINTWNSGGGWMPIGQWSNTFSGYYDGNRRTIKGLYINNGSKDYAGLFGHVGFSGTITDVYLEDVSIAGDTYVGGIAGYNEGTIEKSYTEGMVKGIKAVGGFVGQNSEGSIQNCYSMTDVVCLAETPIYAVAGFLGIDYKGTVRKCYSTGKVTAANLTDPADRGFIGVKSSTNLEVRENFWDITASGQTSSVAYAGYYMTGLTTAEMQNIDNYIEKDWDFVGEVKNGKEDIWVMHPSVNNGYPFFRSESMPVAVIYVTTENVAGKSAGFAGNLLVGSQPVVEYGVFGGTAEISSLTDEHIVFHETAGSSDTSLLIKGRVPGLETGTQYYIRPYAITANDTTYGMMSSFTTSDLPHIHPLGEGTADDPYLISCWEELLWMSKTVTSWDKHFFQTNDIDFADAEPAIDQWDAGAGWYPVGNGKNYFKGRYDGGNKEITGLLCKRSSADYIGLFGCVGVSGQISNLVLNTAELWGDDYVGSLSGLNNGSVTNCYATGAEIVADGSVGSLVGLNSGEISRCYGSGNVVGKENTGGFVGYQRGGHISDCYTTASVTGIIGSTNTSLGGFAGYIYLGDVSNCYSTGTVVHEQALNPEGAGFAGKCYNSTAYLSNCYWNVETSVQDILSFVDDGKLEPLTSAEMQVASSFEAWSFDTVWNIDPEFNSGFPYLEVEEKTKPRISAAIVRLAGSAFDFSGSLTTNESVLEYGLVCGNMKSISLADENYTDKNNLGTSAENILFSGKLENLKPGSIYYALPYAVTATDTVYGNMLSIKTHSLPSEMPKGTGSEQDPYLISNWQELLWLSLSEQEFDKHYLQTADIDLAEAVPPINTWNDNTGWFPIGERSDCRFNGVYDGGGHLVKGLYCNRGGLSRGSGLFGYTHSSAQIMNVGVVDAEIVGSVDVGALVGNNAGSVQRCFVTGSVTAKGSAGGLVGDNDGPVSDCFSKATITRSVYNDSNFGGFVGVNADTIVRSYSVGAVAYADAVNPRSNGFAGLNGENSQIISSYWDIETSGQAKASPTVLEASMIEGLTNEEMKQQSSFTGWGFADIWNIDPEINMGLPYLFPFASENVEISVFVKAHSHKTIQLTGILAIAGGTVEEYGVVGDTAIPEITAVSEQGFKHTFASANESMPFEFVAEELLANTTYYFRPYFIQGDKVIYGQTDSCTTHPKLSMIPKGEGTEKHPYLISNWQELVWLSLSPEHADKHFLQTADINMALASPKYWSPIAPFTGVYNGGGKKISNLYCYKSSSDNLGLFTSIAAEGIVADLGLESVYVYGDDYVGAFAGKNYGTLSRCYSTGTVKGDAYVGGLVGATYYDNAQIRDCFSRAYVSRRSGSSLRIGGLVGYNSNSSVLNSYSAGRVYLGSDYPDNNGFVGDVYLVADSKMTNNFWDKETANLKSSLSVSDKYATAATTVEMKTASTFTVAGWDFVNETANGTDDVWAMHPALNGGYPFLTFMHSGTARLYVATHAVSGTSLDVTGLAVVGDSPVIEHGVVGSTDSIESLVAGNIAFRKVFENVTETQPVAYTVTGLQLDTKYLYRSYVIVGTDTVWGEYQVFSTHELKSLIPQGEGTDEKPYLISNWQELYWVSQSFRHWDKHFVQTANIDLASADTPIEEWDDGKGWSPIGNNTSQFAGVYDGNGMIVSSLTSTRSNQGSVGMFSVVGSTGVVENLGLYDVKIEGGYNTGALAGSNSGAVSNCFAIGSVLGTDNSGGFIGSQDSGGKTSNCFSRVDVTKGVGGYDWDESFGGLMNYAYGKVINTYSTGKVEFITGDSPVNKGLFSYTSGDSVLQNYWDIETSAQTSSGGAASIGLTTAEMKQQSSFVGWDFAEVWKLDAKINSGYPYLVAFEGNTNMLSRPELKLLPAQPEFASIAVNAELLFVGGSAITAHGFILDTIPTTNYGATSYVDKIDLGGLSAAGTVSGVFDHLEPNSVFYLTAFATNSYGTVYTDAVKVYTLPEQPEVPEGTGDPLTPYLISNLQELYWLADQVNSKGQTFEGKFFRQTADIDASPTATWFGGIGWRPIGQYNQSFKGSYNGDGFAISGLTIDESEDMTAYSLQAYRSSGLFGVIGIDAHVQNVTVMNNHFTLKLSVAGGLCGRNYGLVENSSASGTYISDYVVGGLFGMNMGTAEYCNSEAVLESTFEYKENDLDTLESVCGGFAGVNYGKVLYSRTNSQVFAFQTAGVFVGQNDGIVEQSIADGLGAEENKRSSTNGFVGSNNSTVINCYSRSQNVASGFGSGRTIQNCYSVGKAMSSGFGYRASASFWDTETSTIFTGGNEDVIGLVTAEMTKAHHYIDAGWDFVGETTNGTDDIWVIHPNYNNGYPFLAWEAPQLTYLGGTVYYDRDKSNNQNAGDVPISGLIVELLPEGTITGTARDGSFLFYAEPGDHTVKIHAETPYSKGNDDLEYPVTVQLVNDTILSPVGLYGQDVFDFDINLATVWTRCGRTVPLWAVIENNSNVPADIVANIAIDKRATVESVDTEASASMGNNYEFTLEDMQPYESKKIRFNISTPNAMTDSIAYTASISHKGEVAAEKKLKRLVRCSYDPNDVQVFPEGIQPDGNVPMKQELTYMIRFQNTGNDTAFMVDVYDTLSPILNPRTFKFVTSSHPVRYFVNPDGSMRFLFEDINLLDSTTNEPESHGFILFKVKPDDDVVPGDVAELRASIYFDYNPPVITNTVKTTFTRDDDAVTQVFSIKEGWNLISLYVEPEVGTVSEAFSSCLSSIDEIKTLDKFYNPAYEPVYSSLKEIKGGVAYLIKANGEGECSVTGLPVFTPFEYSLGKGWNMIGCPVDATPDFSDILNNISTEKLINFDAIWLPDAADNPVIKFEPGKGYFIYNGSDGTVLWGE